MAESRDYTLGLVTVNLYALGLLFPIMAVYFLPYVAIYGWQSLGHDLQSFFHPPLLFLIAFIGGIVVHELIHAICWSWLDDIPWQKIHFGVKWGALTPYVHCEVPIQISHYRCGVAMPALILGILPYLGALVFQNGWLLGFGSIFTWSAGGDIIMLWLLRDVQPGKLVQDHPNLIGCRVLNPNKKEDGFYE